MQVELHQLGHSFGKQRVFSGIDLRIEAGEHIVLLGGNGSGKSTLIKILCGALQPLLGKVLYRGNGQTVPPEHIHSYTAIATPYTDLIEDFTLRELLSFYKNFKKLEGDLDYMEFAEILQLPDIDHKPLKDFSSGMRQRTKLALAVLSRVPLLFLDEPLSNLDPEGRKWYRELLEKHLAGKTLIVGSNFQGEEYFPCGRELHLREYKFG